LNVYRSKCFLDRLEILLEFIDAAGSARRGTIIVVTRLLGKMRCWMPFLVLLVAFLVIPVLLIIGAGIAAFSIAAAASVTATSSALLCE
jgi:hypothetical protein